MMLIQGGFIVGLRTVERTVSLLHYDSWNIALTAVSILCGTDSSVLGAPYKVKRKRSVRLCVCPSVTLYPLVGFL